MTIHSKRRRTERGTTPRFPPTSRPRIQPYISSKLHDRLGEYCIEKNVTESSVVEAALSEYLDETRDALLMMRRLDRLGRSLERHHRDLELLSQAFGLFVQFSFAHAPAIPSNQISAVRRTTAGRFKKFMENLGEQYSRGHRFLDDLPKEPFADDSELEVIAKTDEESQAVKGSSS